MKSALIQCGDHFENQSRILPLALHLNALGIRPIVMLYSRSCSKLLERNDVITVYLDDYRAQVNNGATRFPFDYEKIFFIERARAYSKFSTTARLKKEQAKVDRDYTAILRILEETQPGFIFVWNGFTGNVANILRVIVGSSNKYASWYMERSFFNRSLFIDHDGVNGAASIARYFDDAYNHSIPEEYLEGKSTSETAQVRVFPTPYLFVPLQVQTDTNNILYSPYLRKMRSLVLLVVDTVEKINKKLDKDLKVVVRHHPEEVERKLNLPQHPLLYYRPEGEIKNWCNEAVGVVNINSTVGLEAIFLRKPVFSFGRSIYSHDSLSFNVSPNDFYEKLEQLMASGESPVHEKKMEDFFQYLFHYNTCNLDNLPASVTEKIGVERSQVERLSSRDQGAIDFLTEKTAISVACYLSPLSRVNLTYRNNSLELSPDLYRTLFRTRLGYAGKIRFGLLKEPEHASSYDFVLRDEKHAHLGFRHNRVLDEYLSTVG